MTNVYFIRCGKLLKIGKADDVGARMVQLQTGNPAGLQLLAILPNVLPSVERLFHRYYAAHRARGEWFRYDATTAHIVRQIQAGARPTTLETLQYYNDLKPVKIAGTLADDEQKELGRAISEIRKKRRETGELWPAFRETFAKKGGLYLRALSILENGRERLQ